ncbi:MAG: hypothetical protein ACOZNI_32235 [Myxococcota bacterium]
MMLAALAAASDVVVEVGEDRSLGVGGGWARAFPAGDGAWHLLWSAGGDYNVLPMGADLTVVDRDRVSLTGRTDLVDHGIARCPDGTYLHVASASLASPDDSAFAFRYDADWTRLADATVEESVESREHNDPAVACSPVADGVILTEGAPDDSIFVELGDDAAPAGEHGLDGAPQLSGGSFAWDPDDDTLLAVGFGRDERVRVDRYDADLGLVERLDVAVADPGDRVYWTQATLRAGEHWLVAYMVAGAGETWTLDEANVALAVFDLDWALEQTVRVTQFEPPAGAMRPGLARDGDTLLVTYDRQTEPHLTPLTLDLDALGELPDTGDPAGDEGIPPIRSCGCGGGGGAFLLVALARRPRWRSS